jgi:uroporphyrinogen decarboxylase
METFDEEILKLLSPDFRHVSINSPPAIQHDDRTWTCEWGLRYKKIGYYYEWQWYKPLGDMEDVSDIEEHRWPDTEWPQRVEGLEKQARAFEDSNWAVATSLIHGGIFEIAWWKRGFEEFVRDMHERPDMANALLDKTTDMYLKLYDQYLDEVGDYVQMVMCSDDLGGQNQLLISPLLYRKYLKPRHKKLFDLVHSKTDAKIFFHSDGSIVPIIPDLIKIGVDILNPVMPLANGMESERLKRDFGDKLIFHGGIDEQRVLPFGSTLEVEAEVKERIKAFGPGGGYVVAPTHNIQPDVRPENILAFYKAVKKYGKYPIRE